jgi:hypothetical protein
LTFDTFERTRGLELAGKETWSLGFDFRVGGKKCFMDHWSKISSAGKMNLLKVMNTLLFHLNSLTFSVRHLNAINSTARRRFLSIKPLPALQQM